MSGIHFLAIQWTDTELWILLAVKEEKETRIFGTVNLGTEFQAR